MNTIFTTIRKELTELFSVKELKQEEYTLRIIDKEKRCSVDTFFSNIQDAIKSVPIAERKENIRLILINSQGKYIKIN